MVAVGIWAALVVPTNAQSMSEDKGMMQKSLYERLGGMDALKAVVDDVVTRAAADTRINKKFAKTDIPRLKVHLVQQLCFVTGGPCKDIKDNNKQIHRHMAVTEGEFNAFVEDLTATLNSLNVPAQEQSEVLGLLGSLKGQIVEVNSAETGTPLPDKFKPAKPLSEKEMQRGVETKDSKDMHHDTGNKP